jgi:hypothetical protein
LAVLLAATGFSAARADELSDLRANNTLLQQKLDQISQEQRAGAPEDRQAPRPGNFPRSFAIPGTETSVRIGGTLTESFGYSLEH